MSNFLKFCSCRQCRRGMRDKWGNFIIKYTVRKNRRSTKQKLKYAAKHRDADVEIANKISVPYTD
jgi:hypothetical protein